MTKRTISSEIAKITQDPLGLLAPVIVRAKMLLQRLWTLKIGWDESLPADVHTEWTEIELHGFCDASERAYGACVYLRTITPDGHVWTRLLTVKSKVVPLKSQTIPRLELSGAPLLTSLATTVLQTLPRNISRTVYWTDTTIVLHWINTSPHTLKIFVANRVTEIQQKTHTSDWRRIPTTDNPADLISRGQSPEDFLRRTIWQHGPEWLQQSEEYWSTWNPVPLIETPEQKKSSLEHAEEVRPLLPSQSTSSELRNGPPSSCTDNEISVINQRRDRLLRTGLHQRTKESQPTQNQGICSNPVCLAVKAVHIELVSDLTRRDSSLAEDSVQQSTLTTVPTLLAATTNYESSEISCSPTIIR
ncbi:uncharacterized protein LOC117238806 [Bombus vosnesenskii]|uniref:Uncharacterized protein LOC117238806 n=1 Tax=Bombus vosnesenskii TaxID=207650 RepID=A0A6J3L7D2_9HYME|nr:uncharacterized protein LOC117238806 [Bombus vosnesenskii]